MAPVAPVPVDKEGLTFDPRLHIVHGPKSAKAGQPVLHRLSGELIRKQGMSNGLPTGPTSVGPGLGSIKDTNAAEIADRFLAAGPKGHQQMQQQLDPSNPNPHLVDVNGNAFDAEIHETNIDGSPKLSPTGKLITRKGKATGRAAGSSVEGQQLPIKALDLAAAGNGADDPALAAATGDRGVAAAPTVGPTAPPVAPVEPLSDEERLRVAKSTAEMTVQLVQALGKFIAGSEGKFKKDEEHGDEQKELKDSITVWYQTMDNLVHVSPGWLVAVHTGKYLSRCAETDIGKKRIEKGTSWLNSTWSKLRGGWHLFGAARTAKQNGA